MTKNRFSSAKNTIAPGFLQPTLPSRVFPLVGWRSWLAQAALVAAAVGLPTLCHLAGAPVRWLLPMHWPALFAGLIYGWRGGLLVGLLSPATNWMIGGYPLPPVLPAMTAELAVYGFTAGWLRERLSWNSFGATAGAVVAGRLVFALTIFITAGYQGAFMAYLPVAMAPGFAAGLLQVGALGWLSQRVTANWGET